MGMNNISTEATGYAALTLKNARIITFLKLFFKPSKLKINVSDNCYFMSKLGESISFPDTFWFGRKSCLIWTRSLELDCIEPWGKRGEKLVGIVVIFKIPLAGFSESAQRWHRKSVKKKFSPGIELQIICKKMIASNSSKLVYDKVVIFYCLVLETQLTAQGAIVSGGGPFVKKSQFVSFITKNFYYLSLFPVKRYWFLRNISFLFFKPFCSVCKITKENPLETLLASLNWTKPKTDDAFPKPFFVFLTFLFPKVKSASQILLNFF